MTDTQRRRFADALSRLALVDAQRNQRRAEYEIALAALVEKEREHALTVECVNRLKGAQDDCPSCYTGSDGKQRCDR